MGFESYGLRGLQLYPQSIRLHNHLGNSQLWFQSDMITQPTLHAFFSEMALVISVEFLGIYIYEWGPHACQISEHSGSRDQLGKMLAVSDTARRLSGT